MPIDLRAALNAADAVRPRSQQTADARADGQYGVGPSDYGRCRRAIQYRERPPADLVRLPEDKTAAALGTILHEGILGAVPGLYPGVEVSGRIPIPGLDRGGEFDVYDPANGELGDVKTLSEYRWDRLAEERDGFESDFGQLSAYGLGLRRQGRPVRVLWVWYLRRSNADDYVPAPREYDEGVALDVIAWLVDVLDMLDAGVDLPRDRRGPDVDGICARCPFRQTCWDLPGAEAAGRSPWGWQMVRDDPAIEAALGDYLATTDPKVRAQIRDAVRGAPAATYGTFRLRYSRVMPPAPVPDDALRLTMLEQEMRDAAGAGRPPRDPSTMPAPLTYPEPKAPRVLIDHVPVGRR